MPVFLYQTERRGREQYSGETERERECVCVREAEHCGKRKIELAIKQTVRE